MSDPTSDTRPADADPVIAALRAQARAYDPDLPAGSRRRLLTALDATLAHAAPARAPFLRWPAAAATALVAVATLAVVLRPRPAAHTDSRPHRPNPITVVATSTPHGLASTDPVTLAHRFVDAPLESEFRALVSDLTRATNTVTSIFPAPKRTKPTTQDL